MSIWILRGRFQIGIFFKINFLQVIMFQNVLMDPKRLIPNWNVFKNKLFTSYYVSKCPYGS